MNDQTIFKIIRTALFAICFFVAGLWIGNATKKSYIKDYNRAKATLKEAVADNRQLEKAIEAKDFTIKQLREVDEAEYRTRQEVYKNYIEEIQRLRKEQGDDSSSIDEAKNEIDFITAGLEKIKKLCLD